MLLRRQWEQRRKSTAFRRNRRKECLTVGLLFLLVCFFLWTVVLHTIARMASFKILTLETQATVPLPPVVQQKQVQPTTKHILIVGAGAAGLTAAKRLVTASLKMDQRIKVHILEASSGWGGRIQKDTFQGELGEQFPIDLGASWVSDPKRLSLIAQNTSDAFNLELRQLTKAPSSKKDFASIHIKRNGKHKDYPKGLNKDKDHLWVNFNYTWYDFFQQHLLQPSLKAGLKISYNTRVESIQYERQGGEGRVLIQARCSSNQKQLQEFWADHVLVTVPLSILQQNDIEFSPPLPNSKELQKAKMWQGFKIFLEFSQKFYHDNFFWLPDDGEVDFWDYGLFSHNLKNPSKQHILAGYYIGAPYRDRFHNDMDDSQIVERVLNDLDEAFGGEQKQAHKYLTNYRVVNWNNFPFIRGIYADKPVQRGPMQVGPGNDAKLLLAGEAFPIPKKQNGWVDGAALSGLHAAELMLREIDPQSLFTIPEKLLNK